MHSGACRNAVLEDGIAEKNLKAKKLIGSGAIWTMVCTLELLRTIWNQGS